jgi:hypothetical protein
MAHLLVSQTLKIILSYSRACEKSGRNGGKRTEHHPAANFYVGLDADLVI